MQPPAEHVHWLFATGFLLLALCLLARAIAGAIWAIVQPYRLTLLHPHGVGFWWLFVEPPLLVIGVGIVFALLIAPGLIDDLEDDAAAR